MSDASDPAALVARCPACGEQRVTAEQRQLVAAEALWSERMLAWAGHDSPLTPLPRGMQLLAAQSDPQWFWACDACIERGAAVAADVTRQNLSMGTPFAAYVDRPFRCEDCKADVVFSAREQHHWFETLGFLIWVYPKQCAPCRARRRHEKASQRALAEALHGLDPNDPTQLDAVARLYAELGRADKASELARRAKNKRRREPRE